MSYFHYKTNAVTFSIPCIAEYHKGGPEYYWKSARLLAVLDPSTPLQQLNFMLWASLGFAQLQGTHWFVFVKLIAWYGT